MDTDNGKAVVPAEGKKLDVPRWNRSSDMLMQFAGGPEATALEVRWRLAKAIAGSGMTHQKKPEAVLAIMLTAYEMGLPVMQSLRGMYLVNGKIALEGHLMDALAIDRCKVTKTIHEQTMERCKLTLHRPGWDDLTIEYGMEDAIRAGLVQKIDGGKVVSPKAPWREYPKQMLYWRALSNGLRQIAPDYFGGVYALDEMEDEVKLQQAADTVSTNEELDALDELDALEQEIADAVDATQAKQDAEKVTVPLSALVEQA